MNTETLGLPVYLGTRRLVLWLIPLRAKQLHDPSIVAVQLLDDLANKLPARRAWRERGAEVRRASMGTPRIAKSEPCM